MISKRTESALRERVAGWPCEVDTERVVLSGVPVPYVLEIRDPDSFWSAFAELSNGLLASVEISVLGETFAAGLLTPEQVISLVDTGSVARIELDLPRQFLVDEPEGGDHG